MLGDLLAAIVVGLLKYLQTRQDLRAAVRAEIEKECMAYAIKANEWKARAGSNPDADRVRVLNPTASLSIPNPSADISDRTDLP